MLRPPFNAIPTDQWKEKTTVVMCVSFHMVLEHTAMVGLRRCIEIVRFLTPICDLFSGIAAAIEH